MNINRELREKFYGGLAERSQEAGDAAAERGVAAKTRGGKVAVVTGSGPNLHEGVTTLIAELIEKGVVDGVTATNPRGNDAMGGAVGQV
ncbi:MAG: hypothetical protein LIO38_02485 [Cloacibacillus sp.]|nr:hypothetical protein [Cloacibacillus sp.]